MDNFVANTCIVVISIVAFIFAREWFPYWLCIVFGYYVGVFAFEYMQKRSLERAKKDRNFSKIEYKCGVCGCEDVRLSPKGTQTGLYCTKCGSWIKWVGKREIPIVREYIELGNLGKIECSEEETEEAV